MFTDKDETFDVDKAIDAQKHYCSKMGQPYYSPLNGMCPKCRQYIFQRVPIKGSKLNTYTGISVQEAGKFLVTQCPHCNTDFI